jgi:hypothetical protein
VVNRDPAGRLSAPRDGSVRRHDPRQVDAGLGDAGLGDARQVDSPRLPDPVGRRRRPGRARLTASAAALMGILLPFGYVFAQFWTATSDAADFVAGERRGIAYARPLTRLLAALVDGQAAAARRATVDVAAVRAAVDDVSRVDDQYGETLGVRQRWSAARAEIETTLARKAAGQDAQREYAGPIGLTQALLADVGGQTKIVRDPTVDGYHLVDAALFRVPEVIVNAGHIAVMGPAARSGGAGERSQVDVANDRVVRASEAINAGLRMSADSARGDAIDLALLVPLDEFVASVDSLVKLAAGLGASGTALADLTAAHRRVHRAGIALNSAVLAALDALLEDRGDQVSGQRRAAIAAGVVALLAGATVLWSGMPGAAGSSVAPATGEPASTSGAARPGGRADPDRARDTAADLISARDLHDLVQAGQGQARRRRDDDPR